MSSKQIKKLHTNVRSAQSLSAMAVFLTVFYIVKALISHNFNFYFCTYIPEYQLKNMILGSGSKVLGVCMIAVFLALMIIPTALLGKKPGMIGAILTMYAGDTFLLLLSFTNIGGGTEFRGSTIDVIFHLLLLVFFIVGAVSSKKLSKLDPKEIEEALKKEAEEIAE